MKFNIKKSGKLLVAASLLLLSITSIKAQTSVGYTCDVYVDANSNLIHDVGEININNAYNIVPVRSCAGYGTGTFYGNCPGAKNGGYVGSCNANNYIADVYHLGNMIQPAISVNNYTILGSTFSVTIPVAG